MESPPRWICDAMLGRLARYLRILGCDTLYDRGWEEAELLGRLRTDPRILVTRNRRLGAQVPGSIVLRTTRLSEQPRELAEYAPGLPRSPRFDRCTACNGPLENRTAGALGAHPGLPERLPEPLFQCQDCRHPYWEGSHTARLRKDLATWLGGPI